MKAIAGGYLSRRLILLLAVVTMSFVRRRGSSQSPDGVRVQFLGSCEAGGRVEQSPDLLGSQYSGSCAAPNGASDAATAPAAPPSSTDTCQNVPIRAASARTGCDERLPRADGIAPTGRGLFPASRCAVTAFGGTRPWKLASWNSPGLFGSLCTTGSCLKQRHDF